MNRIEINSDGQFSLEGEKFVIDLSMSGQRPSTSETFAVAKSEPYLRLYENLASEFSPRSILELGIYQGGSYVLLDALLKPHRLSGVEINGKPVASLLSYISRKENRFVHFATSQRDGDLKQIVLGELRDELDLVVDDASHTYEDTKASFETLFPLLQPGGIYVIEDWS